VTVPGIIDFGAWGRAASGGQVNVQQHRRRSPVRLPHLPRPEEQHRCQHGRQFISEGVAAEADRWPLFAQRLCLWHRASAFFGNSVHTDRILTLNFREGRWSTASRVSQTDKKYYSVGLSALKASGRQLRYREEEGFDLWLRPLQQVDLTGRSTYNSSPRLDENSMPPPMRRCQRSGSGRLFAHQLQGLFIRHEQHSALSITNRSGKSMNGRRPSASTPPTRLKNLTVAADCKFYSYDQSGDASYSAAKPRPPEAFVVGAGLHRMPR